MFASPWSPAFIPLFGQTLTLNQLEHSLILEPGVFDEPRLHFAVNCTSVGCPALRSSALVAGTLDEQLDDSQQRFLSDRSHNRFDAASGRFRVSEIFDCYGEDFARRWGSLEDYLRQQPTRVTTEQLGQAANPPKVEFLDYDWPLNPSS